MNWDYYYNLEGDEWVRANLVYTPYVSPDKKTFCMSFNRDVNYHKYDYENVLWTEEHLDERFSKELEFHKRASTVMPTLKITDVDASKRQIFLDWHGDDFYMQGLQSGGYDAVLPDWKDQWKTLIHKMWECNITKMSLHPNSWVAKDGVLIPFNWFFCYDSTDKVTIKDVMLQISQGRQEKLLGVLEQFNMDLETPYDVKLLQKIAFYSFKSNYPEELINSIIEEHVWE